MTETKRRLLLVLAGFEVTVIVLVLVIMWALNALFSDKVFLALLVLLLGAAQKILSRIVDAQGSTLLLKVDKYPGNKYEDRVKARNRDVKLLQEVSFYTLLVLVTAVALIKALSEGGG